MGFTYHNFMKRVVFFFLCLFSSSSAFFCPFLPASPGFVPFRPCVHRANLDDCNELVDCDNREKLAEHRATVDYDTPLNLDGSTDEIRATRAVGFFTKDSLAHGTEIGSKADDNIIPPGYEDINAAGCVAHRGHLIAKQLGGSGKTILNLVALTFEANHAMRTWENLVKHMYDGLDLLTTTDFVEYDVTANYAAHQKHPVSITLKANIRMDEIKYCPITYSSNPGFDLSAICTCAQSMPVFEVTISNDKTAKETVALHNRSFLERWQCGFV